MRVFGVIASLVLFLVTAGPAPAATVGDEVEVMKVDEAYRLAKLQRDVLTLARILAPDFNETNQNGNSRSKEQTVDLWKTFTIDTLTTDTSEVRVTGNTAVVSGTQTENGQEHMLFIRAYIRSGNAWQLQASMQYRNPSNQPGNVMMRVVGPGNTNQPGTPAYEVMRTEEAYRVAKLHQDIPALDRVLAEGFTETNQNGNSRNKTQSLDLWKTFSVSSLTTDTAEVRVTGDSATVLGTQTENGYEHMLFTRVYVRTGGGWQLLTCMQFRDPKFEGSLAGAFR
ncbi:MAG: nuclear transport factor 2 family protein [Terriglobia bacterium]